jgi:PleD family two-component response regulator
VVLGAAGRGRACVHCRSLERDALYEPPTTQPPTLTVMVEPSKRPMLVLIASHGEWVGRSVESVFELNGFAVLRVAGGRRALDLARRVNPDAILLDDSLSEMGGVEVCRALRDDPLFDHSIPVLVTSPAPASNRVRMSAYEAGAWDFCSQPLDVETLLLKLTTFVRARRRMEDVQASSLVDSLTGLYNAYGLQQWAEQLGARALRKHEAFACVAVTSNIVPDSPASGKPASTELTYMADVCRSMSRKSDVVGYVGESRFAILAPDTDESGARQFVDRLQRAVSRSSTAKQSDLPYSALHAGFYAVPDLSAAGVDAHEVLHRAKTALLHAQREMQGKPTIGAFSFSDVPVS